MTATVVKSRFRMPELSGDPWTVEHFRAFARYLVLDNGEFCELEPHHEEFARSVFEGFGTCVLVVPEGNGKTTFTALLLLYKAYYTPDAMIAIAASSRDQARIMYKQAKGFVTRTDELSGFKCFDGYRRIDCRENGAQIEVFAADDRTGDGIIPDLGALDELHRHRTLALMETWQGKLGKKKGGQIVAISTAGEVGSEFEEFRTRLRQEATSVVQNGCFIRAETWANGEPVSVLHDWAVPEDGDINNLDLVLEAQPASFVTREWLQKKRAMIPNDQHWSRFTCNRAARSVAAAISEKEWFAAVTDERIPVDESIVAGLDLGWKYDTTALVPLWVRDRDFRLLGPAEILTPPRNGDTLDPRLVEEAIRKVHKRNPIRLLVMDMTDGANLAGWCRDELDIEVVDRGQTRSFQVMDYARFTEALREGWLRHSGDPGLTRHVLNAVAKVLPGGDIVFERPSSSRGGSSRTQEMREIDALDAACFAHTLVAGELDAPPVVGWAAV